MSSLTEPTTTTTLQVCWCQLCFAKPLKAAPNSSSSSSSNLNQTKPNWIEPKTAYVEVNAQAPEGLLRRFGWAPKVNSVTRIGNDEWQKRALWLDGKSKFLCVYLSWSRVSSISYHRLILCFRSSCCYRFFLSCSPMLCNESLLASLLFYLSPPRAHCFGYLLKVSRDLDRTGCLLLLSTFSSQKTICAFR